MALNEPLGLSETPEAQTRVEGLGAGGCRGVQASPRWQMTLEDLNPCLLGESEAWNALPSALHQMSRVVQLGWIRQSR